jgi:tetratricopeptide (TPR) repeat protein
MTFPPGGPACAAADEALTAAAFCTGDLGAAERLFAEVEAVAARAGDRAGEAFAVGGLGMVLHHRNIAGLIEGAALAEAMEDAGDLYGRSEIHRHLGFYYLAEDVRPREAIRQLGHLLALREKPGDPRRVPSALVALGEAEMAAGDPRRAAGLLGRAVSLAREANLLPWRIQDAEQNLRQALRQVRGRPWLITAARPARNVLCCARARSGCGPGTRQTSRSCMPSCTRTS